MKLEKSNNNAISTNAESIDFYINLGSLYEQKKQWPSAIAHYRLALRINPNLAIVYKKLADLWYKLNRFDKAAEAWYKVLELDIKLITESESIAYYQTSISLSHNSVETYRKLAQVWLQLDKKTEAIASLEKAIALELKLEHSEDIYQKPEVWVKAGDNLANAERWDEAIVHYQRAIEIEPTYHQSYQNVGIAFAKVGKIEDAIASYASYRQVLESRLNSKSLVSVGIPTYNRSHLIKRSITSVINQDYDYIEIVISDNASTDETPLICQELCQQYEKIKYIRQPTNYGPIKNFREVLEHSNGEFFMWLADDDYLDSSYISECVSFLQKNPDYSLVCGQTFYFRENNEQDLSEKELIFEGERINLWQEKGTERVKAYYQQVADNGVFYGLYRRNQLLRVPMNHTMGGDWLFVASIAFLGKVKTLENVSLKRSRQ